MAKKGEPQKTNAMRELEKAGIPYRTYTYECGGEALPGTEGARLMGVPEEKVYKTLVARGHSGQLRVFVIPVAEELDLKKAARAAGEKSVEMLHVRDLPSKTGYVRGGCSPLAMKKGLPTVLEEEAEALDTFLVSAGRLGMSVEVDPRRLATLLGAPFAPLVRER